MFWACLILTNKLLDLTMRFLKLSLVVLIVLAIIAPIASAQDGGEGLTIGFSQIGSESAWRTAFTEAVQAEAEERGHDVEDPDDRRGPDDAHARGLRIRHGVEADEDVRQACALVTPAIVVTDDRRAPRLSASVRSVGFADLSAGDPPPEAATADLELDGGRVAIALRRREDLERVTVITKGTLLRFSIFMQAWQCANMDACGKGGIRSDQPYAMHLMQDA